LAVSRRVSVTSAALGRWEEGDRDAVRDADRRDDGHRMVLLPQNWTVTTQSAKPGQRLRPDAKIVLGCARIGPTR
jgi:hypothetical protein